MFNSFYLFYSFNQSFLGVKKRLGHVQIGLLKSFDQHPHPIHMGVPPGTSAVKAQNLTVKSFKVLQILLLQLIFTGIPSPEKKIS